MTQVLFDEVKNVLSGDIVILVPSKDLTIPSSPENVNTFIC
ncbi:unnamed protein product [Debaryomyces tyrocola]|nr:unnamed protein product [Debaryomyces tyrocola]